jgi:hypothetical protein
VAGLLKGSMFYCNALLNTKRKENDIPRGCGVRMLKYEIVVGRQGRAHIGLFGYSQFEQFINPLGATALGLVGYEA